MNNQTDTQTTPHRVNQVTTASKYLALLLFISLPFIGGFVGYQYGLSHGSSTAVTPSPVIKPAPVAPESADVVIESITDFYTIDATYPNTALDQTGLMADFVENIVAQKQTEWQIGGEVHQAEMAITAEFPDRPAVQYALDIRYASSTSALFNSTSYVFYVNEATGGANSNTTVTSFTFDQTGLVTVDDVFALSENSADISLTRVVRDAVIAQYELDASLIDMLDESLGLAFLEADGVTFDPVACQCDGFFFPSNFQTFSLSNTGVTFTFGKFAILPGVFSTPHIFVPWADLAPFLTPEFASLAKTAPSISEYYISQDQSQRLFVLATEVPSYELVIDGVSTNGLINTERGYGDDIDATVYILNHDQPAVAQQLFVRLTESTNTLIPLTTDRRIDPAGDALQVVR